MGVQLVLLLKLLVTDIAGMLLLRVDCCLMCCNSTFIFQDFKFAVILGWFRLESRDDSLETLLMYMGGWHRVSNKNQPHISSIKFLKNRDFFIVVRRLHLSKALWNCLRRLHHLSKGCGIVSLVYITYRKGVELSPSSTSPIERVSLKKFVL